MKLQGKKTGAFAGFIGYISQENPTIDLPSGIVMLTVRYRDAGAICFKDYKTIAAFNADWEDYEPVEPIFDEKIRRGIRAWWDMQDNPFKAAAVLCHEHKDLDGFYHWRIFGYIRDGEQKESTDLCFRTKKLYAYDRHHDYTKEELCGEE